VLALTLCLGVAGCGKSDEKKDDNTITIGCTTAPHGVILKHVKDDLKEAGYELKIKEFADYQVINDALADGSLDANFFQHQPYLDGFNEDKGQELVSVGSIHFEPLGIYADDPKGKTTLSVDDFADGDKIAVPNDATNEARALLLLEKSGVITLKKDAGVKATKLDIETYHKKIEITELDAAKIPSSLPDVKYAIVNGNFALDSKITDKCILTEDKDDVAAKTYANVIAVKKEDKNNKGIKALVKILKSDKTKEFINKEFKGIVVPAK
ncbi:MAG: MetQ/NlpA family ABC transporter substrate-binding protein, partial [Erysipelotrichaceae bacterium]